MDPWNKRIWLDPIVVVFAALFVALFAVCNWYWSGSLWFGIASGAGMLFAAWYISLFLTTIGGE